jgi:hypothetical protein
VINLKTAKALHLEVPPRFSPAPMKSSNKPKHPHGPPMTLGNMRATGLETRSSNERRVVGSSGLAAEAAQGRRRCRDDPHGLY